ncbi:hypothetical protein KY284_011058 [Solanum tuberosum]|nr:hypothetical protein KY284_011058 [Solanum tuberosum]
MNQVKLNIDTKVKQVVIGLKRAIGPRTSNRSRLIWDPGRGVGARKVPLKGVVIDTLVPVIQWTGFIGQNDTSLFWDSLNNTGYLFLPYISMNHFKGKLALHCSKLTYAKSPVVHAQISNILALLQKIENKCSVTSKQVIVEDVKNPSPVDNVERHLNIFINDHPSHVDNMFNEMPTKVFTKEVEGTSSASSLVAALLPVTTKRKNFRSTRCKQ